MASIVTMKGTVASYDARSYGIIAADGGTQYLFQSTDLAPGAAALKPGDRVQFDGEPFVGQPVSHLPLRAAKVTRI